MRLLRFISAIALFLYWAPVHAENSAQITPCELRENAGSYDRALVTVRAQVTIGFEESRLVGDCGDQQWIPIWVTFGGDLEDPAVFCCGDHSRKPGSTLTVNDQKVGLQKDAEFEKYYRLLTSFLRKTPSGVACFYDCYQYRVTATLTGRFFAGEKWKNADGTFRYGGYGHLGCCSLFVIQKVEDVEAEPTGIPIDDRFECSHQSWPLPVNPNDITAQQKAVQSHLIEYPGIDEAGEKLVRERMQGTMDQFESGAAKTEYEGKFSEEKKAAYVWLSNDKLRSYTVRFERFDWLSQFANHVNDRIWTPVRVEYSTCKPKP